MTRDDDPHSHPPEPRPPVPTNPVDPIAPADPGRAPLQMSAAPLPAPAHRRSRLPGTILALSFGVAIIILALTGSAYFLIFRAPVDAAGRVADGTIERGKQIVDFLGDVANDVSEKLQFTPKVSINEKVIIESRREIAELATHEETFTVESDLRHEHFWSQKRIRLRGTFVAKAGFNLEEQEISVIYDEETGAITTTIPEARILSVESLEVEIMEDKDGLWNRVTDADRQKAYNDLLKSARDVAQNGPIRLRAEETLQERLLEIIDENRGESDLNFPDMPSLQTPAEREIP